MRPIQLFLLFLLAFGFFNTVSAQAELNKTDSKGRKQGFWRKNFPDGTPRYEGNFKDNQPAGIFRYFQETGELKMVCYYSDKGRRSHAKGFDIKGNMISDGNYYEQKKDSVWTFYNEVKQVVSRETYNKGIRTGIWYVYYPEGNVSEEMTYVKDKRHGPWLQYFEDSSKRMTANYKEGLLHGKMIYYHANGKMKLSGNYVEDLRQGTWYHFDESGNLTESEVFKNGVSEKPNIQKFEKLDKDEQEILPGQ